jgi:hypothetical protein
MCSSKADRSQHGFYCRLRKSSSGSGVAKAQQHLNTDELPRVCTLIRAAARYSVRPPTSYCIYVCGTDLAEACECLGPNEEGKGMQAQNAYAYRSR